MTSKIVTDRVRAAAQVVQAAETHAEAVEVAIAARVADATPPKEKPVAIGKVIRAVGRVLAASADRLDTSDRANEAELADDAAPRDRRDELAARLLEQVMEAKEVSSLVYGAAAPARLGINGDLPRDPVTLRRLGATVAESLPQVAKMPVQSRTVTFDHALAQKELAATVRELSAALEVVAKESREAEATLKAKQAAIEDFDQVYEAAATALSGLFLLAGERELADRVKPPVRRRTGKPEAPEAPEPPAPPAAPANPAPVAVAPPAP